MLRLRTHLVTAAAVLSALAAPVASAQNLYCTGLSCLTTTTTSIGTTAGVVALIIYSVSKKPERPADTQRAAQAAELYLRQNALQLAQDLAVGDGPVMDELFVALQLSEENRPAFDRLLRQDRKELLAMADLRTLDEGRALRFVDHLAQLMKSDPGLRADLERLASSN